MIVKAPNYVKKALVFKIARLSSNSVFHDRLGQMFEDQDFIMKLSEKTRILPNYFNYKSVKQFSKSPEIHQYHRYVTKEKLSSFEKHIKHSPAAELFQTFPKFKKYIAYLDCYLDWLSQNKLKKHSNEYYKNKCTMEMFDMRNPQNWFADNKNRQFVYHHGPTNSGKTSSAIKELKQLPKDKKGIYMAPLRLLAWQMQQKLENCNLITGQDKQYRVSNLTSCTIEALNTNEDYDVAIIDEIQMIGDSERGWSWTRAILSTKAKKIHLCGDQRAIGLISKLVKQCGGTLEERKYSRLGKLKLLPKIFEIKNIQQGDCMIEFSVETLHKLRRKIKEELLNRQTQKQALGNLTQENQNLENKCSPIAMVYGRLPPQCRKEQARKFNANIAPYLVATNAIGMGLNLNIKKIIFAGIKRRNSKGDQVDLQEHEIQQIAGRAGRGLNDGLVQCASYDILKKVRKALRNVNKTYGINLEDQQISDQTKSLMKDQDDFEMPQKLNLSADNLENYDAFLKRVITKKQRSIQKAGLFVEYVFLKRMIIFLQQYYSKRISLTQSLKMHLNLSLKSQDLYFLSEKVELLEWISKLQEQHKLQTRDTFQIAKGLSMHYNSYYSKQKMSYYASQFQRRGIVNIPKKSIEMRNQKKVPSNFLKLDILQSNYSVAQVYINLWNRYEFVFWDIEEAKRIKEDTSKLIKKVLEDQDGFTFTKQRKLKEKQVSLESEEAQNTKLTILDEETSDIEKITI